MTNLLNEYRTFVSIAHMLPARKKKAMLADLVARAEKQGVTLSVR